MSIEAINGINSYGNINQEKSIGGTTSATNSIFDECEEFMGLKADTRLIDKMKTFFETLESAEYDPRNTMFPEYNSYI